MKGLHIVRVTLLVCAILALVSALTTPVLAGAKAKVQGQVTGVLPWGDADGNLKEGEFQYHFAFQQVNEEGAAKGWAYFKARTRPGDPWGTVKVAVDCAHFFVTEDGRPAAIYSGTITESKMHDWYQQAFCDWEGQLKIGMVIDGGTALDGDEIVYWMPQPGLCFYPDEGVPLGCAVPEGSLEIPFTLTGGDVKVSLP